MNRNIRIARELVRMARELVAFKGAQKIIDAIVAKTGWDINDPDEFKRIDDAKKKVTDAISWAATVDGKVRDVYFDWLRNCACDGEIEMFIEWQPNALYASRRTAMFFKLQDIPQEKEGKGAFITNHKSIAEINKDIAFLFHGNPNCKETIDDVNGKIKSKTITIGEMKKTITPVVEKASEESNSATRTRLMRKFDENGQKVYSNGNWSVILFDDVEKRKDLVDFAGHCTKWCITMKSESGSGFFRLYCNKYYVICNGNKPTCCFYGNSDETWFETADSTRFCSKSEKSGNNIHELYEKGDQTMKELLKDIIPDICGRLGIALDWKVG